MNIDITKPVKTRDGREVEIISDKGRGPLSLLGYISDSDNLARWTKEDADFQAVSDRIACVKVTYHDGQFDEE